MSCTDPLPQPVPVKCPSPFECKPASAGMFCQTTANLVIPTCSAAADCADGTQCVGGKCLQPCVPDQCQGNERRACCHPIPMMGLYPHGDFKQTCSGGVWDACHADFYSGAP